MIRVRFAPSPTGHLHIGGVRTALFNYLYARNQAGEFILRIEDTDMERSSPEMAEEIIQGLLWLGIAWDQEPYYQSHHFDRYRQIAFKLVDEKKAYRCFCTSQDMDERKKKVSTDIIKYDRQCYHLPEADIEQKLAQKIPYMIRFFIPPGTTAFKDRIHKEMTIDNSQLDDYVLLKSDGSPTYHLSVVADDADMGITDVMRGDDHISNTYKQILLYLALGLKPPRYAHLPLILGQDRKKLSKRHGETSIMEFKRHGYLPEAMVTYLSQLSWLPGDDKQIFTLERLIEKFSLQNLSRSSPVFDYDKLRFLNSRAIQQRPAQEIYELLAEDEEFSTRFSAFPPQQKLALIELIKPRMKTLQEIKEKFHVYLAGENGYRQEEYEKMMGNIGSGSRLPEVIGKLAQCLESLESFHNADVERTLRSCADELGVPAADLIHSSRFALTGENVSPPIFDIFAFFGRDESIQRLKNLTTYINHHVLSH